MKSVNSDVNYHIRRYVNFKAWGGIKYIPMIKVSENLCAIVRNNVEINVWENILTNVQFNIYRYYDTSQLQKAYELL